MCLNYDETQILKDIIEFNIIAQDQLAKTKLKQGEALESFLNML